jgi:thiamine pyrophosphate-dependent acetolactate synthase large subunit-like protein
MTDPKSNQTSVPERIIELLEAEGIKTLFGIPDPLVQHLHRAAVDRGWEVIAPHHESAGAFMADAMARMTGRPAIICGNEGPGVANLLPAAICASKEKIPVIFLGGQRARRYDARVRRSQFQYTHQPEFFRPAMKYVGIIEFAEQVDDVMHEAFRQAMSGTPGPVYVELPEDHSLTKCAFQAAPRPEQYRMVRQLADPSAIEAAADLIAGAELPIILSGTGVHTARGHDGLEALANLLGCPVIPSWGGRGTLPDTHPQVLHYSAPQANEAIAAADVVLAVGTGIGEPLHYGSESHWSVGRADRKWIYVERDPGNIGVNRPIDIPLIGNLVDILPQLRDALIRRGPFNGYPRTGEWRRSFEEAREALISSAPDTYPIHPGRMIAEVTKMLPEDTVIVRDGGCTSLWELAYHRLRSRDYIWTSKFGHLGTGLPYAIGAQLAVGGGRRVCLITGDSAFQFHISELETAVRKNLPIVCVVNYDAAWGMEHVPAYMAFGENKDVEVKWGAVRFDRIAEGFGAYGQFVERTADIAPAIRRALDSGRTSVVQIAVDPAANALQAPNFAEFATWYGSGLY